MDNQNNVNIDTSSSNAVAFANERAGQIVQQDFKGNDRALESFADGTLNPSAYLMQSAYREVVTQPYFANKLPADQIGRWLNNGIIPFDSIQTSVLDQILTTLIRRIGLDQLVTSNVINPYAEYYKGTTPNGAGVALISRNLFDAHKYDPTKEGRTLFKNQFPEVNQFIATTTRDGFYKVTVEATYFSEAFTSQEGFDNFISLVFAGLEESYANDEYMAQLQAFGVAMINDVIKTTVVGDVNNSNVGLIQEELANVFDYFTQPNAKFNKSSVDAVSGYIRRAFKEDIRIFIDIPVKNKLTINWLANTFHLEVATIDAVIEPLAMIPTISTYDENHVVTQADFDSKFLSAYDYQLGEVIPAGTYAVEGATGSSVKLQGQDADSNDHNIIAIILEKDALQNWHQITPRFESQTNAEERTVHGFYHFKEIKVISPFHNTYAILRKAIIPTDFSQNEAKLSGNAQPNANITVYDVSENSRSIEGSVIGTGTADENGHFEVTLSAIPQNIFNRAYVVSDAAPTLKAGVIIKPFVSDAEDGGSEDSETPAESESATESETPSESQTPEESESQTQSDSSSESESEADSTSDSNSDSTSEASRSGKRK